MRDSPIDMFKIKENSASVILGCKTNRSNYIYLTKQSD